VESGPWGPPAKPKKGAIAKGLAYERKLGRHLWDRAKRSHGIFASGEILGGQWIEFTDRSGPGFAQPDYLVLFSETIFILEAKLTRVEEARTQLADLYKPLVEYIWPGRDTILVEVTKNLAFDDGVPIVNRPEQILVLPRSEMYVWHWTG
jgi:hypothetical protein